jgi:pimeloyl-ACP methyl ester carboxylesterase
MTQYTFSKDGTKLAYSKTGTGEPLILVDGAFCHRKFGGNKDLPPHLSEQFTVYAYDRRGKGESNDTLPYSVEREIEDLQAIVDVIGEPVNVYGISSGAALALEAANSGIPMKKLALYEAPYIVDDSRKPLPDDYTETLNRYILENNRNKAVKYFLQKGVGLPGFVIWLMQWMPAWKEMKQTVHTITYDTLILGENCSGKPLDAGNWSNVQIPTLVISGTKSEMWAQTSMKQLAAVLPNATHADLLNQTHMVKPKILAPMLIEFFRA